MGAFNCKCGVSLVSLFWAGLLAFLFCSARPIICPIVWSEGRWRWALFASSCVLPRLYTSRKTLSSHSTCLPVLLPPFFLLKNTHEMLMMHLTFLMSNSMTEENKLLVLSCNTLLPSCQDSASFCARYKDILS